MLVIFAFPLCFAVYMSFFDYFFAAPGATVDRPFVGFDNYVQALTDPAVLQSFGNVGIFLIINVPLTVVLSLLLASGLNSITRFRTFLRTSYYVPYVTASVAIIGVWLFLFGQNGLVNNILGSARPEPQLVLESGARHADHRDLRDLEGARVLHPAVPGGAAERADRAVRVGRDRRRGQGAAVLLRHRARASARRPSWCCCSPRSPARTCSPSRTC